MNVELIDVHETGPFDFTWWAGGGVEHFARGWEAQVKLPERTATLKHGIGSRDAYGRVRIHSVTWLDGDPIVEGVEPDDYERSHALISSVRRPDRHLARTKEEIPDGYEGFEIVGHRDEIDAKYSRRVLAVKISEDDIRAWATLAILRGRDLGRLKVAAAPPPNAARGGVPLVAGPSRGLLALLDLERGMDLEEFAGYVRLYEKVTGYDASLNALRTETGGIVDPRDPDHRIALLAWLRKWGCRHLRKADDRVSSTALATWAGAWVDQLPAPKVDVTGLSDELALSSATAFADLSHRAAATRARRSGPVTVTFGPTAAAKALYAMRPLAFAPWDEPIRVGLGLGESDAAYRQYLRIVAESLLRLAETSGIAVRELPNAVSRPDSTPPKLIDEYLWIKVTRGLDVE